MARQRISKGAKFEGRIWPAARAVSSCSAPERYGEAAGAIARNGPTGRLAILGEVAERSIALVLKTRVLVREPRVRIPASPLNACSVSRDVPHGVAQVATPSPFASTSFDSARVATATRCAAFPYPGPEPSLRCDRRGTGGARSRQHRGLRGVRPKPGRGEDARSNPPA